MQLCGYDLIRRLEAESLTLSMVDETFNVSWVATLLNPYFIDKSSD